MRDQVPILDVFMARHQDAWRLYVARTSWCPPVLRHHLDHDWEAFPFGPVDLNDMERHMWNTDAPYQHAISKQGGVQLVAKGRSAVSLLVWLTALVEASILP